MQRLDARKLERLGRSIGAFTEAAGELTPVMARFMHTLLGVKQIIERRYRRPPVLHNGRKPTARRRKRRA